MIYGVLLALVRARREVGVSSRNVVSRTFPQFFHSRLTAMFLMVAKETQKTSNIHRGCRKHEKETSEFSQGVGALYTTTNRQKLLPVRVTSSQTNETLTI